MKIKGYQKLLIYKKIHLFQINDLPKAEGFKVDIDFLYNIMA